MKTFLTSAQNQSLSSEICTGSSHEIGRSLPIVFQRNWPRKFPRNRKFFPQICPWKSREIKLFFSDLPEALVSGQSSELSIAHQGSRPTISQLKHVSLHYIKLILELPTTDKNLYHHQHSYHSKLKSIDCNHKLSEGISRLLQCQGNIQAFRLTRLLWWQKLTWDFPAFSLRFVDLAVEFCFRCKFPFHEEWHSSQVDSGMIFLD